MDIQDLRRDPSAVEDGQWVSDIPRMGSLRLKVRGLTSKLVVEARARKERAVPRSERNRDGTVKTSVAIDIMTDLLYEVVLLDWDGLTDNGTPVKYARPLAKEWLTNPEFRHFADAVAWAASYIDNVTEADIEEAAGN